MKNILKSVGAVACAAALICSAGCASTKWSFKSGDFTLSSGIWISYTFDGVSSAINKMQEGDEKATLETIDFEKDEIEGKIAKDWAYAEAKDKVLRYLTAETLAAQLGAKVSDETFDASKYYYSYFYKNYYSEMFEKLGVSEDSYCRANLMPQLLEDEIFLKIYGKDGTKEVTDKDLEAYFVDNYVSYYYISCSLTTKDDSGNEVDLDAETLEKYRNNFRKYAAMLNNDGKTTADVATQYKTDFSAETVPETNETMAKDKMETGDLNAAILETEEGKAVTKEIDKKLYLIYRFKIKDKVGKIKGANDETSDNETEIISREDILKNMKSEEFNQYLKDEADKLECTRNDACVYKYDVMRTVHILLSQK